MNNKPDQGTIMAYLYGELSAKEADQVKDYFIQHPDEWKQIQQLTEVSDLLKNVEEKEVIAPPVFMDHAGHASRFWQSGPFKTMMSIAATFLLFLVAARLIGPDIAYSNGEVRISFNAPAKIEKVDPSNPALTPIEVQQMINTALAENNQALVTEWEQNNQQLQATIKNNFVSNSAKIDALMKQTSQASQDQIRSFVASLQQENLQSMKDYLQLSSNDQKAYVENLLVDFSKYLQEQRKQDLQLFQTRMSSIEKNTDQFKQETEQILANIISNPENFKKVNNY